MIGFENPYILILAPALAVLTILVSRPGRRIYRKLYRGEHPLIDYIDIKDTEEKRPVHIEVFPALIVVLIIIALAGPYNVYTVEETVETQSIGTLEFHVKPPVILVIDDSGSMGGPKIEEAKKALLAFTEKIDGKLDIGLVAFNSIVDKAIPPTSNTSLIRKTIQNINASGGTMYSYPLNLVYQWLKPYREFNVPVYVVFATDGLPADLDKTEPILELYHKEKIPIYTIFIGNDQNGLAVIKMMAEKTGGEYYMVSDINKLVERFTSIAEKIVNMTKTNISVTMKYTIQKTVKQYYDLYFEASAAILLVVMFIIRQRYYGVTF